MTEITGYILDIEFVWGFQSKIVGLSKTSPTFYYPPPTTILGALAEALAREQNIGEAKGKEIIIKLSENLLAIGLKPINCSPIKHEDINRIITIKRTGLGKDPDPERLQSAFDAPATGKTIFSTLDDNAPLLRIFLVFKSPEILLEDDKFLITPDSLWRIHRLGSKESVVSVSNVEKCSKIDRRTNTIIDTEYSFPILPEIQQSECLRRRWEREVYIDPFNIREYNPLKSYLFGENLIPYHIPLKVEEGSQPLCSVYFSKPAIEYAYKDERVIGRW